MVVHQCTALGSVQAPSNGYRLEALRRSEIGGSYPAAATASPDGGVASGEVTETDRDHLNAVLHFGNAERISRPLRASSSMKKMFKK
jgi:hypothetical protein